LIIGKWDFKSIIGGINKENDKIVVKELSHSAS
jgi:hypothetical protein